MNIRQAKLDLDAEWGQGFSEDNPELVIRYMQAAGLNSIGEQLAEYSSERMQDNKKLSEAISQLSFTDK